MGVLISSTWSDKSWHVWAISRMSHSYWSKANSTAPNPNLCASSSLFRRGSCHNRRWMITIQTNTIYIPNLKISKDIGLSSEAFYRTCTEFNNIGEKRTATFFWNPPPPQTNKQTNNRSWLTDWKKNPRLQDSLIAIDPTSSRT